MLKQNVYLGKNIGDRLVVSPLGERAIALGAATHVLDRALSDLGLFPTVRSAPRAEAASARSMMGGTGARTAVRWAWNRLADSLAARGSGAKTSLSLRG